MNFPVIPARMALINVDMQNYFVESPKREGKGLLLLERINAFAAICRAAGILVIHTQASYAVMEQMLVSSGRYFRQVKTYSTKTLQRRRFTLTWSSMSVTSFWKNRATAHSMPPTWI